MKITCVHCNHVTDVPDSQVPEGLFKIKCPSCSKIITANKEDGTPASSPNQPESEPRPALKQPGPPDVRALIEAEVAKAKGEILETVGAMMRGEQASPFMGTQATELGNRSDALICVRKGSMMDEILQAAEALGYNAKGCPSIQEAYKELQSNTTALVVVDDTLSGDQQDARKLISQVNGWHGRDRRNVFLVLISANLNTADTNQAFLSGTNLIVNEKDLSGFTQLVEDGKRQFQQLYYIYHRLVERKIENALRIGD